MMTAAPSSVLVLGAGELGTSIISALASHPSRPTTTQITVLLRSSTINSSNPAKQAHLSSLVSQGVALLAGDISTDSEAHLASLFSPFHTVIGAMGMTNDSGTQLKVCKAVLAARVACYFPWQFGVDYDAIGAGSAQDLFTEQLQVRALLRGQKETQWVIVSTGMFMSFLFEEVFGVVQRDSDGRVNGVNALGSWKNRVTVTAVEDIGRVVAELVFEETGMRDRIVLTSGETVSYKELADILENLTGREMYRKLWSLELLTEELDKDPKDGMRKYRIVFAEGVGVSWDKETTFNSVKGWEMATARTYAQKIVS